MQDSREFIDRISDLEKRIDLLESRNKIVDDNKKWETSKVRHFIVAILTYGCMVLLFVTIGSQNYFIDAIVPTLGFLLSTLSLDFLGSNKR